MLADYLRLRRKNPGGHVGVNITREQLDKYFHRETPDNVLAYLKGDLSPDIFPVAFQCLVIQLDVIMGFCNFQRRIASPIG
jgi:hypothetical protein